MKRPFAVIGFSMLISSLLIIKLSLKMTVALIIGAIVIFCVLVLFKKQRKEMTALFVLASVVIYALSFLVSEIAYYKAKAEMEKVKDVSGVICEIPRCSDEAFTYMVKLDGENFKIRYVSQDNKMLLSGDRVKVKGAISEKSYNEDFFENGLASRVYFTIFESNDSYIEGTGETDFYYSNIGKIKTWYSNALNTYLPNEIGEIAKAMTIGEKSGIQWTTIEKFNYSGTSHILVISGLHLSIWIMGFIKILEKFCKSNKVIGFVGLAGLFAYSALVGFTPSVVRAGTMVGVVLLGRIFSKPTDSVNSVGMAVAFILTFNPFAVMSLSFWFTMLSTMGLLILPNRIIDWLKSRKHTEFIFKNKILLALLNLVAVSISISIFTLPIFIVNFEMIPVASLISNLLIVDIALLLMILTVVAVLCHGIHLFAFSKTIFLLTGVLGNIIKHFAEKISMSQWSTISVSHQYFKYFLVVAIVCICVALLMRKTYKDIVKHVATTLGVVFILLSVYTTYFDYSNPSVDIMFTDDKPIILVNSQGETAMVGIQSNEYFSSIKTMMNSHNKKAPDEVAVCEETVDLSSLTTIYDEFGVVKTYFYSKSPKLLKSKHNENVKNFVVGESIKVDLPSENEIAISSENQKILFLNCSENVFKNFYEYDIIFLYGENSTYNYKNLISCVDANKTEIILAEEWQKMTIYFE